MSAPSHDAEIDLAGLSVLAALAASDPDAGLAGEELVAVLERAEADVEAGLAAVERLLREECVRAQHERFVLGPRGAQRLLEAYGALEAALDPSPSTEGMVECPSLPWITQVQTAWIDAVSLNYAVDPEALTRLLPAPLEPEVHRGSAWVQVLVSSLREMRPQGLPALFGVSFHQVSYRATVRYRGRNGAQRRGGYFVRSETDHVVMRAIGNALNEFRFHEFGAATITNERKRDTLDLRVEPQNGDPLGHIAASFDLRPLERVEGSAWSSVAELQHPLIECYDAFGVDTRAHDAGSTVDVYVLTIDRDPWHPVFVRPRSLSCAWFEHGPLARHARFDSALYVPKPCAYRWRPLRRERLG